MTGTLLKRLFDLTAALVALSVLWPLMTLIAVAIRVTDGRPILFRQLRVGRDEQVFEMRKFRTMTDGEESDRVRLTRFGRFLRATSLDELPELINVIRGEMSLVGPRPLLVDYLPRYDERQRRRHEVRPGLTGLAQVHGRNDTTWAERLEFDVRYVETRSFSGDLRIIGRTIGQVLRGSGALTADGGTMPEFTGGD